MFGSAALKKWRENYYLSNALAIGLKPLHLVCSLLSHQLETKIKKNGGSLQLPNGEMLRIARDSGVGLASLLYWNGLAGFERDTCATLRFLFERCSTFVDVGSNYGFYSLLGALWNPNLRVISFEPVPEIFRGLEANILLNALGDRISAHQLALSYSNGTATLYLPPKEGRDAESTGTLVHESWQRRKHSPSFGVETIRFEDFERKHPIKVDLVKIDVEDFEAAVISGMQGIILRDRPFIVCEVLPREHGNRRTRELLQSLGYHIYWITPSGYIRVSNFEFQRKSTDFLLSPVYIDAEIVSDLSALWGMRQACEYETQAAS